MKKIVLFVFVLFIAFCFGLNILGLMNLFPLFISSPLLFLSLFLFIAFLNNRKKFKGFY
ncbi:hypothetical protein [Niallia sp. 01092]|uniref:hypothetical protein n=1 Tax=unclassified Niallia TaxID=2837522 RepID=UPI003FD3C0A5